MAIINGTSGDDILNGTASDDIIDAGKGDDTVKAGKGNDTVYGGKGDDYIDGQQGNDKIFGGDGDDTILGGDGRDAIHGDDGDDTIDGGDGIDYLSGGKGDDTITGGEGGDQLRGGDGDDDLSGGAGNDRIYGDAGDDVMDGGDGYDYLQGGTGDDEMSGGAGNDQMLGQDGDDTILGEDGCDTIIGGAGDDLIDGGAQSDLLKGGIGDDTIIGGAGNDYMFGQDGDDTLVLGDDGDDLAKGGQDSDTFIVAAGNHTIIGGEDADGSDIDVLDLSGLSNYTVVPTGAESGKINFYDSFGNLTSTTNFSEIERIICFTPDTAIATMQGEVAVQDLKPGDRVFTRDNGAQKIRWVGHKRLTLAQGNLPQKYQPIRVRKGALGNGLPERDMLLSPSHRVLLTSKEAQLYFDETEVLVAAKHLVGMPGIERTATHTVDYVHFLCDRHEIVLSNGAWTESFLPGEYALNGLESDQRDEIFALFPELKIRKKAGGYAPARRALKGHEARLMTR